MATIVTSFARLTALCLLLATAASAVSISIGSLNVLLGNGTTKGAANGAGTAAALNSPQGCALDASGNLYFADTVNNVIRKVEKGSSTTTTWTGVLGTPGDGLTVTVQSPYALVFKSDFSLAYIPDFAAHRIFTIDPATATLQRFVGTGLAGSADGTGTNAQINGVVALTIKNSNGDLYVTERIAQRVRKVTAGGTTSAFVGSYMQVGDADGTGTVARFNTPMGVAVHQTTGNVYIADSENQRLRMATEAGVVTTVGGNGTAGNTDGLGPVSRFVQPWGLVFSPNSTYLYIADKGNNVIRRYEVATTLVVTVVGHLANGWASSLTSVGGLLSSPSGVCLLTSGDNIQRMYITGDHSVAYVSTPQDETTTTTTTTTTAAPTTTTSTAAPTTTSTATPPPTTTAQSNTTQAPPPTPVVPLTTYPPSISAAPTHGLFAPIVAAIALLVCFVSA